MIQPGEIDKSQWGDGPWQSEQDYLHIWDAGFVQLIQRNPDFGNLCGYVGLFPGHPWHGLRYELDELVEVHGGITWGAPNDPLRIGLETKKAKDHWFVGFDCGHAWDLMPGMRKLYKPAILGNFDAFERDQIYRSWGFVRSEVQKLFNAAFEAWKASPMSRAKGPDEAVH